MPRGFKEKPLPNCLSERSGGAWIKLRALAVPENGGKMNGTEQTHYQLDSGTRAF